MSSRKKNQGYGPMNGIEKSPKRQAQEAKARKRQEKRWASKCGPVVVRRLDDDDSQATRARSNEQ